MPASPLRVRFRPLWIAAVLLSALAARAPAVPAAVSTGAPPEGERAKPEPAAPDEVLERFLEAERAYLDARWDAALRYWIDALDRAPARISTGDPLAAAEAALALHRLDAVARGRTEPSRAAGVFERFAAAVAPHRPWLADLARRYALEWRLLASGNRSDARADAARLGCLSRWRVVGPFDNERGGGFTKAYGPEEDIDLGAVYEGKKHAVRWRRLPVQPIAGTVELDALFRPNDECLAYALAFVRAERETAALARISSNEGFRLWLNGRLVASEDVHRPLRFDQSGVPLRLEPGWNAILIKVAEAKGAWAFAVRLTAPGGGPLEGVTEGDPDPAAYARLRAQWRKARGAESPTAEAPAAARAVSAGAGGEPPPLEAELRRRIEAAPEDARAHYLLGALLRHRHPHDESSEPDSEELRRAHALDPAAAAYAWELALSLERETEIAAERDDNAWRRAMEAAEERGSAQASYRLARYYLETFGNLRAARRHLDRALHRNPTYAEAILLEGEIERRRSFPLARERALARAAMHAPEDPEVMERRARAAEDEGRLGEAVDLLSRLLQRDPGDWSIRRRLADLRFAAGEEREAARIVRAGALFSPFDRRPYRALASYALASGDFSRALEAWDHLLALAPEDHEAYIEIGAVELEAGRRARALAAWRSALELQPNLPELRRRLELLEEQKAGFEEPYLVEGTDLAREARAHPYGGGGNEPARVLYDLAAVEVHRDGTVREVVEQVVEILNDRGARLFDRYVTYYVPGEQVLEFRRGRVVRKDGTIVEAGLRRYEAEVRGEAARERRSAWIDLPPLARGDVFEVRYVREDIVQSFFGDYFGRREYFAGEYPIARKVLALNVPAGRRFYFHKRNFAVEPRRIEEPGGESITYVWEVRDVPAVEPEPAMPPPAEVYPAVEVSTFEDWNAFARWYWNLIRKQFRSGPEIETKVRELTSGRPTPAAKARAIYNFIVTEIRYNAWEFGVHGFKPYDARTVFARRFGDCKDKATLLSVMFKEAGIIAHPVLIRAEELRGREDLTLPMIRHFNHCISYVPELDGARHVFLDGTASHHSFEELPSMDRGATVLVVTPEGGEIRRIPWNAPEEISIDEEWTAELNPDFSARLTIRIAPRGDYAVYFRSRYEIAGERRRELEEHYGRRFAGAKVIEEEFSDLGNLDEPVRVKFVLTVPRFAAPAAGGARIELPDDYFLTGRFLGRYAPLERRRFDLLLGAPRTSAVRVRILLPPGWRFASFPQGRSRETRWGRFALRSSAEAAALELERTIELTTPRVPAASYPEFRELAAEAERAHEEPIRIERP